MKKKNEIPELLCPVGSQMALRAAVENGANAVYLGLDKYSARNIQDGFNMENILEALNYCHLRGVKVYIALNIILLDREIEEVLEMAKDLYTLGADAFIVQDVGLVEELNKLLPDMPVHISTQATIYSADGIKALENMFGNIKRVVVARETTLEEIKEIKEITKMPLEVFVHGALCVSYSGQCLMSSLIGARSGNRGRCAQPCRMKYDILESSKGESFMAPKEVVKQKYCLSPKDICLLEDIPDLINAGVNSFKIEGRMKSPEYVGLVTKIYRKYIDMAVSGEGYLVEESDKKELIQIFSRGGFTKGYLENSNPVDLIYSELPKHTGIFLGTVIEYISEKGNIVLKLEEDLSMGDGVEVLNETLPGSVISFIRNGKERVTEAAAGSTVTIGDIKGKVAVGDKVYKISSKELNDQIAGTYLHGKNIQKIDIEAKAILKEDKLFELELKYMDIVVIAKSETLVQKGINRSLTKEDLIQSISKFGDTSFNISNIQIDMDEGLMIPASQINIARREAARQLEEKICDSYTRKLNNSNLELSKNESKEITKNKISAYLYTIDNLEGMEEIDKVYLPFDKVVQDKTISSRIANSYLKNKEIVIDLGNISKGQTDKEILNNIDMLKKFGNVLVGNLEQLEMLKGSGLNIELDSSLNVYNSSSIEGFKKIGIKDISLSNELTKEQISRIDNRGTDLSINIYGRLSAMTLQSCMISNNISKKAHCSLCDKKSYYLKDRVGEKYPILSNTLDCRNTILSSDTLFNLEAIQKLKNTVTVFRIYFYDETSTQRRNVISKVVKVIDGADASSINTDGYSKGHFSRGV